MVLRQTATMISVYFDIMENRDEADVGSVKRDEERATECFPLLAGASEPLQKSSPR